MPQGTIKKLFSDRGFGFLDTSDGDLFFHRSAVRDTDFTELQEGQTIEYEKGVAPQGKPCATSVRPIG